MNLEVVEQIVEVVSETPTSVNLSVSESTAILIEPRIPGVKGDQGDQGLPGTIVAVSDTEPTDPAVGDLWVRITE